MPGLPGPRLKVGVASTPLKVARKRMTRAAKAEGPTHSLSKTVGEAGFPWNFRVS